MQIFIRLKAFPAPLARRASPATPALRASPARRACLGCLASLALRERPGLRDRLDCREVRDRLAQRTKMVGFLINSYIFID
jgi:hypothetical protein